MFVFVFCLKPFLFAGHPISIDGLFDDWHQVPVAYVDTEGDSEGADYATLKISYDNEFIFIYFDFFHGEFLMQGTGMNFTYILMPMTMM